MGLSLEIPDAVSSALRLPPAEVESRLRLELAISLYTQEILSLGKAAELARLSRIDFNTILARRGIPMHYNQEELAEDASYGRSGQ
jgi:predicted HTH domain antitoxin